MMWHLEIYRHQYENFGVEVCPGAPLHGVPLQVKKIAIEEKENTVSASLYSRTRVCDSNLIAILLGSIKFEGATNFSVVSH
jgi:hypothetical protein